MKPVVLILTLIILFSASFALAQMPQTLQIETASAADRTELANLGADIQYVDPKFGWVIADVPEHRLDQVRALGFISSKIDSKDVFPTGYEKYHSYAEQVAELEALHGAYPALTTLESIGQSHEGQELWCLKISDNAIDDETDEGALFLVGMHHAREILSPEVALHVARQLLDLYGADEMITAFVDNREIFIVPSINPDGGEYDHSDGRFKLWRKNRCDNDGSACKGVDLNRNYGYEWGGAGSTNFKCDLTYRGAEAFSEPETQAVRDFVTNQENVTTLISLHTYSELILYPWSYQRGPIGNELEHATFKTLAGYMAAQNGYTPQQSAELYLTTGDTTDWAYGALGVFAFTFELSPSGPFGGAFYPKPDILDRALPDNFSAILLAIGLANDPTKVLSTDLWKLEATASGADAIVTWASIIETEPTGWNVLVADSADGDYETLNPQAIPANIGEYQFTHSVPDAGTYYYKIEYLSAAGKDELFGPVSVEITDADPTNDDDDSDGSDDDTASDDDDSDGCGC